MAVEPQTGPQDGNPAGTHFAIKTLVVLLVLVGLYFVIAHFRDMQGASNAQQNGTPAAAATTSTNKTD